ncbi:jg3275 [Pararge aegeria aegeria]|uniref:Jg3275 protein n=1 Tax=Pararge aegeria aegeria TaxID=348720 RepID=A0A8S4RTQ6_9NEOP|nr:jg3275 [Pararge aegeria aegeria]
MALRLRSGDVPLNECGYHMKRVSSPKCEICNIDEDVLHLLGECVRNRPMKDQLMKLIYMMWGFGRVTWRHLIQRRSKEAIRFLVKITEEGSINFRKRNDGAEILIIKKSPE